MFKNILAGALISRSWIGDRLQTRVVVRTVVTLMMMVTILMVLTSVTKAIMAGQGLMWSVAEDAPVKLVVCWENPEMAEPLPAASGSTSGAQRREWVRLALKSSWERYARVLFIGWEECKDEAVAIPPPHTHGPRRPGTGDENIKVLITTSGGGQNPAHGSWGDHQKSGILLNLQGSEANTEFLAIHEFGHALGFYHGEERKDWPSTTQCPEQWSSLEPNDVWWPPPSEIRYGAPDTASIMAYCSGRPTELSPKDIAAVQRAYERHVPGTLLSTTASLCLSAHANQPNGEQAFGWACDEAYDDQEWQLDREHQALYIQWPSDPDQTPRCLAVSRGNISDVQLWDCHYGSSQQWRFNSVLVRGYGGLCLTRPLLGSAPITMRPCDGGFTQMWRLEPGTRASSYRIKSENANMCLTAEDVSGSLVSVQPCDLGITTFLPLFAFNSGTTLTRITTSPNDAMIDVTGKQDFYLYGGGRIGIPTPWVPAAKCLDVRDVWDADYIQGLGGPKGGQAVQVFPCHDTQLNQRWNLSGDVRSGNKCLALSGDTTKNGSRAVMQGCDGSTNQDWDYYW